MKTITELEAMSDDELRAILAELAGWKLVRTKGCPFYYFNLQSMELAERGELLGAHSFGDLPNYPADLNACHEVEKTIFAKKGSCVESGFPWPYQYTIELSRQNLIGEPAKVHANARQRTIALILTLQQP